MSQIKFTVTRGEGDQVEHIGADGRWTTEGEPALFVFRASRRPRDQYPLDSLVEDLAGGVEAWTDLRAQAAMRQRRIYDELERQLWPDGRPKVAGEALAAQNQQLSAAWASYQGLPKLTWARIQTRIDRISFLAVWDVFWISGPERLRHLADVDGLEEEDLHRLWNAHETAMAEQFTGKGRPSAS